MAGILPGSTLWCQEKTLQDIVVRFLPGRNPAQPRSDLHGRWSLRLANPGLEIGQGVFA